MNNKTSWICVGLSTTACFILTLSTYLLTKNLLSKITLIICAAAFAVFWVTFLIEFIRYKKSAK